MSVFVLQLPPMPHYVKIQRIVAKPGEQRNDWEKSGLFQWLFVIRGTLTIGEYTKKWEVGERQSLLLLPDREYDLRDPCRKETVFYNIQFDFQGIYSGQGIMGGARTARDFGEGSYTLALSQLDTHRLPSRIDKILDQMMKLEEEESPSEYWGRQQLFIDFLHLLDGEKSSHKALSSVRTLAERVEQYLHEHFSEELTNEVLANALHFHPNYIARCMKEVYGSTPLEYLQKVRLEQAMRLLHHTEWPIGVVAERVGFNYAPYFSRCFHRFVGMTPLAFRKRRPSIGGLHSDHAEKADAL